MQNNSDFLIRKLNIDDLVTLQQISQKTFLETFAEQNSEENMQQYLQEKLSLGQLSAELNDINALFYFLLYQGNVIGYLKLNSGLSQTEKQEQEAIEIERIYVLKEYHGLKAGQLLLDKAIESAKKRNAAYVWLGVWEENPRAIRFYEKNGFMEFGRHLFKLGDDEQLDIMMKRMM